MTGRVIERLPDRLMQRGGDPTLLGKELLHFIGDAIANQPRSLQKRIGPSEIGHPCARRLAYKMMGAPTLNPSLVPGWKPFVGTCVHSGLEKVFIRHNRLLARDAGPGNERWITEEKVNVGAIDDDDIDGSCDLYDRVTCSVIDWKIVGPSPLKGYKSNGPGSQYRNQAHLYGRGWLRRGLPVDTVMIVFLPRNDEIHQTYVWHEPFDERVAIDALTRVNAIKTATKALGPSCLVQLPTADAYCYRCPYFKRDSTDLIEGCPGHPGTQSHPTSPITLEGKS